jgi:hypothetical protein
MKVSGKLQDPAALPPRKPAISCSTRWAGNWVGFIKLVWSLRQKGHLSRPRREPYCYHDGDVANQVTTSIFKNPGFQRKVL